jgi:ATP-binding cassette subfamily B protein
MTRASAGNVRTLLRRFRADLLATRGGFLQVAVLALAVVSSEALAPWPLKFIVDGLVAGSSGRSSLPGWLAGWRPQDAIVALGLVFLAVAFVNALAEAGQSVATARIRERLSFQIRDRALAHLQTLPPTIRATHRSGELTLRLVGDVDQFARLWTRSVPQILRHCGTAAVTLAGLLWISPMVGLGCLLLVPGLITLARRQGQRLTETARVKRRREGDVSGAAQEIVRGLPVIQATGAVERARQQFAAVSAKSLAAGLEASRAAARFERTSEVARGVAIATVTAGGGLLVVRGWMTVGDLTVLCAYVTQLLRPIDKINELTESVSRGLVAGERLAKLLDERPLVVDSPTATSIDRADGHIELTDVWFCYPSRGHARLPVLRGVSLTCEPGQLTVIVGASGAGKSTIISLLVRLFDPTAGVVRLDGLPLGEITLQSLRSQFAVVTQDLHLFSGTIREVVAPVDRAEDEVEDERLWTALGFVALDEFVRSLPSGLDTALGEDGANLSGGQRQRLSLARAFLLNRPVLLLDEPLANVDQASARVIHHALARLRIGRTCVAITHESSLVTRADVVYRLAEGTVKAERRNRRRLEVVQ